MKSGRGSSIRTTKPCCGCDTTWTRQIDRWSIRCGARSAREIRSCTRYLAVVRPTQGNAEGLIECLGRALRRLGLEDISDKAEILGRSGPVLVGGGTDGAQMGLLLT